MKRLVVLVVLGLVFVAFAGAQVAIDGTYTLYRNNKAGSEYLMRVTSQGDLIAFEISASRVVTGRIYDIGKESYVILTLVSDTGVAVYYGKVGSSSITGTYVNIVSGATGAFEFKPSK